MLYNILSIGSFFQAAGVNLDAQAETENQNGQNVTKRYDGSSMVHLYVVGSFGYLNL